MHFTVHDHEIAGDGARLQQRVCRLKSASNPVLPGAVRRGFDVAVFDYERERCDEIEYAVKNR
jgi:hypothetical protein